MTYFTRLTFHPTHPSSDDGPLECRISAENLQDTRRKAARGHGCAVEKIELFDAQGQLLDTARYVEITVNGLRAWRWGASA